METAFATPTRRQRSPSPMKIGLIVRNGHNNRTGALLLLTSHGWKAWAMFSATSNDTLARVRAALSKSQIRDLRRLTIAQDHDSIVVRGQVSSFYHKQLAQELIRVELGGVNVVNEMQVV
jgi:hypothetical protein